MAEYKLPLSNCTQSPGGHKSINCTNNRGRSKCFVEYFKPNFTFNQAQQEEAGLVDANV